MKRRMMRGGLRARIQRKAAAPLLAAGAILCFLVLFFLFWPVGRELKQNVRQGAADGRFDRYLSGAVSAVWKQWYPASSAGWGGGNGWPSGEGGVEHYEEFAKTSGWLARFLMRQAPYYRYIKGREDTSIPGEPDPSFAGYLESHEVLEEYEYLVRGLSESVMMASGNNPLAGPGGGGGSAAGSGNEGWGVRENSSGNTGSGAGENTGSLNAGGMDGGIGQYASSGASGPAGAEVLKKAGRPVTGTEYIAEQLADYDFLMKHFYTVHPTTTAGRDMMKAETFLSEDLSLSQGNKEPQILIYHTHSQEEFSDYHEGNKEATIVGVGDYLTELLTAKGYNVIHDTSVYDLRDGKLDRSKAYTYALDGITGILQKYPSIQVVLDVHRDGVKEGTRLVQEVNGKQTATIMFFNGTSQTPTGPIEYLKNSYRTDNMAFSFQMKLCADAYYPGFTRKIYLKGLRYNMHLRPRSALIEVGAQTNTYEEARNAMEPLAELLDMVLGK